MSIKPAAKSVSSVRNTKLSSPAPAGHFLLATLQIIPGDSATTYMPRYHSYHYL